MGRDGIRWGGKGRDGNEKGAVEKGVRRKEGWVKGISRI